MGQQKKRTYRSFVAGLVIPLTLTSCLMHDPVGPADASNASPTINHPPEIWGYPPFSIKVGVSYSFTPEATDRDADPLIFSINNKPSWLNFDASTGRLHGMPLLGSEGRYNGIEISVSDGQVTMTLPRFSIDVVASTAPNLAPEIGGAPATTAVAGEAYSFTPAASDPDGDQMTFSIENMPPWTTFNSSNGQLSGTPQDSDIGMHGAIAISVSDGEFTTSLPEFSINVVEANMAPQISGTPATGISVGQTYSFTPTASDPDGDNLTFSIQNLPAWAQFDATTGALTGTPLAGDVGSYANIVISVSDGDLIAALPAFAITVNQASPGSATVSWTAPTQNADGTVLTNLAGFRIYYGTSPGNYPNQITINNPGVTTRVVNNLAPGTWYFVSTAFNSSGVESDFSNVAMKTIN